MSLWKRAIESSKALLLDEINLGPDALLKKVEEFEGISQATEHSYPALILSSEDGTSSSMAESEDDPQSEGYDEDDIYNDSDDDEYENYYSDSFEEVESSVPLGSLPVDMIADKLKWEWNCKEGSDTNELFNCNVAYFYQKSTTRFVNNATEHNFLQYFYKLLM